MMRAILIVETVVALMAINSTVCYVSASNHVKVLMVNSVNWLIEFLPALIYNKGS